MTHNRAKLMAAELISFGTGAKWKSENIAMKSLRKLT
jgi:hypothetical protein